jgi:hypothetical protein
MNARETPIVHPTAPAAGVLSRVRLLPFALVVSLVLLPPLPASAQATIAPSAPPSSPASAQPSSPRVGLGGVISLFSSARFDASFEPVFGLRFIPEVKFSLAASRGITVDAEASASVGGTVTFPSDAAAGISGDLAPYRGWLRLSTARFEARVGLQKLSFGSATLFRPLMWFDSLDPRDPLQLTDGVYGLLLRYYTRGNANFWAWGLYGNGDRRGLDIARPYDRSPEFGGRVQVPLFHGEIAAAYHHRKADLNPDLPPGSDGPVLMPVPEDRFGLDGKWDVGVGIWFEGSIVHQKTANLPLPWQSSLTLGLDYTFDLGRGLTVLAEQFRLVSSARAIGPGESLDFSALLLRYPLGLLDEVSGFVYYDWKGRGVYRFLCWKHATNALTLNAILFWNPAEVPAFRGGTGSGTFAGAGFELLLARYF